MKAIGLLSACAASLLCAGTAAAQAPGFTIIDLGRPSTNNVGRTYAISTSGSYVAGIGVAGSSPNQALSWSLPGGAMTILPASGTHNMATGINDSGTAIGMTSSSGALTSDGAAYASSSVVVWKNGTATVVNTGGRAFGINNAGIAVGSINAFGGAAQRGALYDTNTMTTTAITAVTDAADPVFGGLGMKSATAISSTGWVAGTGTMVNESGVTVATALFYDTHSGAMSYMNRAPTATGTTSGITAAAVNASGVVVGTIGSGASVTPYQWSPAGGLSAVALPAGFTFGSAVGINDQGWIVGWARSLVDSTNYAFVDIAGTSYLLSSLIGNATGWAFSGNLVNLPVITGIANDGTITGYANAIEAGGASRVHAFALQITAVPEPASYALMLGGLLAVGRVARRRLARA